MNEILKYQGELYLKAKPDESLAKTHYFSVMLDAGWILATRLSDGKLTFIDPPVAKPDELYCIVWVRKNKVELTGVFENDIDILYDIWIDLAPYEKANLLFYNITKGKTKVETFVRSPPIPWASTKTYIEGLYKNV